VLVLVLVVGVGLSVFTFILVVVVVVVVRSIIGVVSAARWPVRRPPAAGQVVLLPRLVLLNRLQPFQLGPGKSDTRQPITLPGWHSKGAENEDHEPLEEPPVLLLRRREAYQDKRLRGAGLGLGTPEPAEDAVTGMPHGLLTAVEHALGGVREPSQLLLILPRAPDVRVAGVATGAQEDVGGGEGDGGEAAEEIAVDPVVDDGPACPFYPRAGRR
jgi:hypothetical protein